MLCPRDNVLYSGIVFAIQFGALRCVRISHRLVKLFDRGSGIYLVLIFHALLKTILLCSISIEKLLVEPLSTHISLERARSAHQ